MRAAVLFSGGRDSALAALLLAPLYDVTLVTGYAGVTDDWTHARTAAERLAADADTLRSRGTGVADSTPEVGDDGRPTSPLVAAVDPEFRRVELDREVFTAAADRALADGHPNAAIADLHEHAVERVAGLEYDAVADGTRRDDRTPRLDRSTARSVEDRHGVDHVAPLAGLGYGAVRAAADRLLCVERGPSETVGRADYEAELRALVHERGGSVTEVFPDHEQSRVTGLAGAADE